MSPLVLALALGAADPTSVGESDVGTAAAVELHQPGSRAAGRLLDLVHNVDDTTTESKYQHNTRVRRREGVFLWDCSGMMNWMLKRVAPTALEALDRERPVARTYYRVISKASTRRGRSGWKRLPDIRQVRPGDVFAWLRPPNWPKGGNTGHVGVILEPAKAVPDLENTWTLRIADASRYTHDQDTRDPDADGGLGFGTILFVTDDEGAPLAYGWFGARSRHVHETSIAFGRVTR